MPGISIADDHCAVVAVRPDKATVSENEARYQALVEHAPDGMILTDHYGIILLVNSRTESMFGYSRAELVGAPIDGLVPKRFRTGHIRLREEYHAEPATRPMGSGLDIAGLHKDGTEFPVEVSLSPLAVNGQALIVCAIRDATERIEARARIQSLNEHLHRAVYESSHRIKNQLQVLAAMVEIERLRGRDLIQVDVLQRIGLQVRSIAAIQDLITHEVVADGTVSHVSSSNLLVKILDLLKHTAPNHQISIHVDEVALPLKITNALTLLMNELVANAIKHGRTAVEVEFRAFEDHLTLEVRDDGPGFQEGFDPEEAGHTGLEIVAFLTRHDLKGRVEYGNTEIGGGRVVITFPRARPASSQSAVH